MRHGLDGMEKVRSLLSILPSSSGTRAGPLWWPAAPPWGGGGHRHHPRDVAALRMVGVRVVLVHGGGKHITALLDKLQVPTRFENGYRYTDQAVLETASGPPR